MEGIIRRTRRSILNHLLDIYQGRRCLTISIQNPHTQNGRHFSLHTLTSCAEADQGPLYLSAMSPEKLQRGKAALAPTRAVLKHSTGDESLHGRFSQSGSPPRCVRVICGFVELGSDRKNCEDRSNACGEPQGCGVLVVRQRRKCLWYRRLRWLDQAHRVRVCSSNTGGLGAHILTDR